MFKNLKHARKLEQTCSEITSLHAFSSKYKHVSLRNNQDYACFVCFIVFNDSTPLVGETKMVSLVETQYEIVCSRTCTLWQVNDPCELVILKNREQMSSRGFHHLLCPFIT